MATTEQTVEQILRKKIHSIVQEWGADMVRRPGFDIGYHELATRAYQAGAAAKEAEYQQRIAELEAQLELSKSQKP